jgi:sugar phosphate isomerase/epimerase
MTPKFSVVEFTTPGLSFAQDLEVFLAAGADGISICEQKLPHDQDDDATTFSLLRSSGLRPSSFFPRTGTLLPNRWDRGAPTPEGRIAAIEGAIAPIGVQSCNVTPGPRGGLAVGEARAIVVGGLRRLARVAAEEGMQLGVELMHPSLVDDFSFATTIPEVLGLIEEAGASNLALTVDTWHLTDGPEVLDQLRENATRVLALHVNDRRNPTRSWCDRVLPGDGTVDIAGVVRSLEEGGFDGWYELEINSDDGRVEHDFPDSLWKWDPLELVTTGRKQFLEIWERAQVGVRY